MNNCETIFFLETELQTMSEETELFLKKLAKLEEVWQELMKCKESENLSPKISQLKARGKKLGKSVRQEGSLNAGGKFEWVESILIKVSLLKCVCIMSKSPRY